MSHDKNKEKDQKRGPAKSPIKRRASELGLGTAASENIDLVEINL